MLPVGERVVLVSGANRGLGNAIAKRLYHDGYRISLGVRKPETFPKAPPQDDRVQVVAYDAADAAAGDRWVEAAVKRFGRVDAIVNNASINRWVTVADGKDSDLDDLWNINVKGPFRLIRAAFPHLKTSGSGRIINIASLSGKRVKSESVAYPMTKFALMALSHGCRYSGWEHGIRTTAICPGVINTDMPDTWAIKREDAVQPDSLAVVVSMVLTLPNNASVSELPVNCVLEVTA